MTYLLYIQYTPGIILLTLPLITYLLYMQYTPLKTWYNIDNSSINDLLYMQYTPLKTWYNIDNSSIDNLLTVHAIYSIENMV